MSLESDSLWSNDDFLRPVIDNDPMLMFDIEDPEDFKVDNNLAELRQDLDEMKVKAELLERALSDVENMRQITANLLNDSASKHNGQDVASLIRPDEDSGYAGSYSHFSIHHEMLSDRVRTEAYRDAIYK